MSNPPKRKGTAAETATLRYAQSNGYPWALRPALAGGKDVGDIWLTPGPSLILEVKSGKTAATGQPGPALLAEWLDETEAERFNAGADFALLVVKRKGTTDPGKWWAYAPAGAFIALLGAPVIPPDANAPICLALASALRLCRAAGYGHPLENGESGHE